MIKEENIFVILIVLVVCNIAIHKINIYTYFYCFCLQQNRSCGLHTSLSRSSCASEFYDAEEGQHGVDDEEFEEDVEGRRSRNVIRATRPKAINHVSNASAEDACSTGVGTSAGGGRAPSDCSSEAEASSEDETVSSQQSDMADSEYNNIHDGKCS